MEQKTQETKSTALIPLSLDELRNAKDLQVADITKMLSTETAQDIESRKETDAITNATITQQKIARGLALTMNDYLDKFKTHQESLARVMASIVKGEADGASALTRWAASSNFVPGFISKKAKDSIAHEIETNAVEMVPKELQQLWNIALEASRRIEAFLIMLTQAEEQTGSYYKNLNDEVIRLRQAAREAKNLADEANVALSEIETKLNTESSADATSGSLSDAEYEDLTRKRTDLVMQKSERDRVITNLNQEFRMTRDGLKRAEVQLDQLDITKMGVDFYNTMFQYYIKINRLLVTNQILLINAQAGTMQGDDIFVAFNDCFNQALVVGAYGAAAIAQQSQQLSRMDMVDEAKMAEVKQVQQQTRQVLEQIIQEQYKAVEERAKPLIEHKPLVAAIQ